MALAMTIWAEMTDRPGLKWISPSHTPSRPIGLRRVGQLQHVPEGQRLGLAGTRLLDEEPEMHRLTPPG